MMSEQAGGRPTVEEGLVHWRKFDPSWLPGGVQSPLARAYVTYRDRLDELLQHEGGTSRSTTKRSWDSFLAVVRPSTRRYERSGLYRCWSSGSSRSSVLDLWGAWSSNPLLRIPLVPAGAFMDVGLSVSRIWIPHGGTPGTWRALIDTGADMTTISSGVVNELNPQWIGTQSITRSGMPTKVHQTYDVRLRFGGHRTRGRWYGLEVVEAQPATPGVDLLIGMDLLLRIDFDWSGPGRQVVLHHE